MTVVNVVTRLSAGWTGVQLPTGAKDFSLLQNVKTRSEANTTSYSIGTRASLAEVKWPGREVE
jgi:hypothetical protein